MKQFFLVFVLIITTLEVVQARDRAPNCKGRTRSIVLSNLTFGKSHWNAFERFVERRMDINIRGCLERRFKRNGRIKCHNKRKRMCRDTRRGPVNGRASYLSKKIHICPTFRSAVEPLSIREKKVCYFALMVHEFSHTCWRAHRKVEPLDDLAFEFAQRRFGTSLNMLNDCNMD